MSLTPSRRDFCLPSRLGGVFILALILAGCMLPTEDVSGREQIPAASVRNAIDRAAYCVEIRMLNTRYIAYTQSELINCLDAGRWIAELEYEPEFYDCEEFALLTRSWVRALLPGIPFGLGIRETGTTHAENIFIDAQLKVWVVDIKRHGSQLRPASGAFYFFVMI